jgi:hypothetical protein
MPAAGHTSTSESASMKTFSFLPASRPQDRGAVDLQPTASSSVNNVQAALDMEESGGQAAGKAEPLNAWRNDSALL